jgi:hypothetical protein
MCQRYTNKPLKNLKREPQALAANGFGITCYSAYFVDLSPMQHAEIITRTEEHIG